MLLHRALVIVIVKVRDGRGARFKFINVRGSSTMVARLPQQVLLLLILVSGTSTGSSYRTQDSKWTPTSTRRTNRALRTSTSSTSSALEHFRREETTREKPSKITPDTSDRSSSEIRLDFGYSRGIIRRGEDAMALQYLKSSTERNNDGLQSQDATKIYLTTPSSNPFDDGPFSMGRPPFNRPSFQSIHGQMNFQYRDEARVLPTRSFYTTSTSETKVSFQKFTDENYASPNVPSTAVDFPRRRMRDTMDVACHNFKYGDNAKQEFYSPNYPANYPSSIDCVRVLEADKGMLLKLDFRDRFDLEHSEDCRYDYLEVRDGQHGYASPLGVFCGNNFPPELTSKTRFLWLRFHSDDNIEYSGFKAVWSMVLRPTYQGVPPEPEPCMINVTGVEVKIHSRDVEEQKKQAERDGMALDCMWVVTVDEGKKIQLSFLDFKLEKPNECDANFVDVFGERTDIPSRLKSFCGSIADSVISKTNTLYIRFYTEPKAINSTFESLVTAFREKESGQQCVEGEFDCEDATCIAETLRCNSNINCRFRWDEDEQMCGVKKGSLVIDSEHIIIILVVFSLIMFGMCFAFVFNCVRKLVRDHRIIQEHIRQSRENRLDEIGRKATPCPISASRTDIRDRSSESPSLEVVPSKELLPPSTLIAHEYTKELVLEMDYNAKDMNDIHQSNNVSNATQERLQESSEEPEMRDNSCQTRESLFDPHISDNGVPLAFSTFGFRGPGSITGSQNGSTIIHQSPQLSHQSSQLSHQNSQKLSHQSSQQQSHQSSQCSGCSPASRIRGASIGVCPRHNPIPAPPGWSVHDPPYPTMHSGQYTEPPDYPSYRRFQSPKPTRDKFQSPKFSRQNTVGSGEKYSSTVYGSGHDSSNTTGSSQHSATPKFAVDDPRYRAEAVIEVDQKRPFSIESTKSAPDVIATH